MHEVIINLYLPTSPKSSKFDEMILFVLFVLLMGVSTCEMNIIAAAMKAFAV